jgi:hypothetical protein
VQLLVESPTHGGSSLSELDREQAERRFLRGGGFQIFLGDATSLVRT